MKKFCVLFILLSFSLSAQNDQISKNDVKTGCKPPIIPNSSVSESNKNPENYKAILAGGVVGSVESIHSAFVNWETGSFDSFSIGTGATPYDVNRQNILWTTGLNASAKSTFGYSYEELRKKALTNPGGSFTFNQDQDFYFHMYFGGVDTVVGRFRFTWQDLGVAGNTVGVNIQTNFGINGLNGFTPAQVTNMMDFYNKVIPIISQVYGPSSHNYTVNVINDANAVGSNTFYNGPNWIASQYEAEGNQMKQPRLMVHELIHAWRDNVTVSTNSEWHYDTTLSGFEEGMAECVAVIVMDKFAALYPNYFKGNLVEYNKRWSHQDGYSFDWDYDFQNHPQLTTTDFWSSDQGTGAHWERYGTSSAAFYKMYVEDPDFFKKFNAEYYRRLNANHSLITSRALAVDVCKTVLSKVEEESTDTWIDKQRVLDCKVVPGKKVHMLTFNDAASWQSMSHDNRIHLIETQNLPGGNEWSWGVYAGTTLTQRWFHQLNNLPGKIDIVNYTSGAIAATQNFRNNDDGHSGPNQGPCVAPNINGNNPVSTCFPIGIDRHSIYTTSSDPAISGSVVNSFDYYNALGLPANRFISKLQTTGLYVYNIEFNSNGAVKGKYYRLHGNDFIGKYGLSSGIRNNDDTPVRGKMYIEQKNKTTPIAGEEPPIVIKDGTIIGSRIWASVPETMPQFQGGRSDTKYSKSGKVHAIYVNEDCTKPQKIDFRNIGYGSSLTGVQMFLFNVDDFEDIIYTEKMPETLCEGSKAEFSVKNNFPDYLDTDSRITYKWINPKGEVVSTDKDYVIASVLATDSGKYTLEINAYDCIIMREKTLTVSGIKLEPTVVSPQEICEGESIVLDVSGVFPADTKFSWTGPNSFTSDMKNPTIPNAQLLNQGTYILTCAVKDCDKVTDISEKREILVNINPIGKPEISCGTTTQNSIIFNWLNVPNATSYTVSYQVNGGSVNNIGDIGLVLSYEVTALQPNDSVIITVTPIGVPAICFKEGTANCKTSDSVLCVLPIASVTSLTAEITCENPTIALDASGSSTGATISYLWTTSGTGNIVSGSTTLNPVVNTAGVYTLTVTNSEGSGCSANPVSVTVTDSSNLTQPTIESPDSICYGSDAIFTIKGTPGNLVIYSGDGSGTATIGNDGTTTITITAATNNVTINLIDLIQDTCNIVLTGITKTIIVNPLPNAGTDGAVTICDSSTTPIDLNSLITGEQTGGVWTRTVGNGGTFDALVGTFTPEIGATTSSFAYTLLPVGTCPGDASEVVITINTVPNAGTDGILILCPEVMPTNQELLSALGGNPSTGGTWTNIGDVYTYTIAPNVACDPNTTITANVVVIRESIPTSVVAVATSNGPNNNTITVSVNPVGNYLYQLDGGDFQSTNIFYNVGVGTHEVLVKNDCGVQVGTINIIGFPEFFTPNGDGINDVWNVNGLEGNQQDSVYIFDRFGKMLKEIKPSGFGWDGTFNGQPLPATDYWFVAVYEEKGQKKEFKSHFALKR
jgi:gliding motility-associated-like protein